MGKIKQTGHAWRPVTPVGPCVRVQKLVDRYNAREFDPFSYLTVCYCGESFSGELFPAPAPVQDRMSVSYLVSGPQDAPEMPSGEEGESLAQTVGGLKLAEPDKTVDVIHLELWMKAHGETDGAGKRWELESENVPLVHVPGGADVRVLAGRYQDTPGAVFAHPAGTVLFDVTLSPGAEFEYEAPAENTTFVYVFGGKAKFGRKGRKKFGKNTLLRTPGGEIYSVAHCSGVRFLLFSARPEELKTPVLCPEENKKVCRVNGK